MSAKKTPSTFIERLKYIGPSVVVAGSVVGSGTIALTPLLGAAAGFTFLWWLLLSLWSKPLIQAEISRYVIVKKKTFLESFSDMPGPKTNFNNKKSSWLVWFMFIGVVPSIAGMGGLAGAVAESAHLIIEQINISVWVIIVCSITWLILFFGTYKSLEKILLYMVCFFSLVTLIIAIAMQYTNYSISSSQILSGFAFNFDTTHAGLALAVFGFTGISYGEIMAYTYWCLEKGYADHSDKKNWIKIMQTDVWATVFFVTICTVPFFLLGASILHTQDLYPPPDGNIITTLLSMFTTILGNWAKWFFVSMAFIVLFSTMLSGTAAFTRTITDYLISMGLIIEKENTRTNLIKLIAFFIPLFSCVAYFLMPDPISLLLIAGIWAAIGLPIVNIGAIYLCSRLDREYAPKPSTKIILWITFILQLVIAILLINNLIFG